MTLKRHIESAGDPAMPAFWFVMSLAMLVGFITSYPMNWWPVRYHLKHGMMTVRRADASRAGHDHATHNSADGAPPPGMSARWTARRPRIHRYP